MINSTTIEAERQFVHGLPLLIKYALIGSAGYLPDQAKDIDFLILVDESVRAIDYIRVQLEPLGFRPCAPNAYPDDEWGATRRGDLNLIVTHDPEFFEGRRIAFEVCKYLRIESRDVRVAIHQIVGDGMSADEATTNHLKGASQP